MTTVTPTLANSAMPRCNRPRILNSTVESFKSFANRTLIACRCFMPEDKTTMPQEDGAIAPGTPPGQPVPAGAVSAEPIPALPAAAPKPAPPAPIPGKKDVEKDTFRELVEGK